MQHGESREVYSITEVLHMSKRTICGGDLMSEKVWFKDLVSSNRIDQQSVFNLLLWLRILSVSSSSLDVSLSLSPVSMNVTLRLPPNRRQINCHTPSSYIYTVVQKNYVHVFIVVHQFQKIFELSE